MVCAKTKLEYDNMLFGHNLQIEITIYYSLENNIINWSGNYD